MRKNGGGSLTEAIGLAGLFLVRAPIGQQRERDGKIKTEFAPERAMAWDGPLAVLIDGGSAAVTEIFAAAIHDHGRDLVIGDRTGRQQPAGQKQSVDLCENSTKDLQSRNKFTHISAKFFAILAICFITGQHESHMDIPRPRNSAAAAIAVLPALLMPLFSLSHAKGEDFTFILIVYFSSIALIAMVLALILKYRFYRRTTPLVRIDETSLTFFGNAPSQQRSFQRHVISGISLSRRPKFWRSAFRFSIVVDGETVDLWLPNSLANSVPALDRALQEQFPGKFGTLFA